VQNFPYDRVTVYPFFLKFQFCSIRGFPFFVQFLCFCDLRLRQGLKFQEFFFDCMIFFPRFPRDFFHISKALVFLDLLQPQVGALAHLQLFRRFSFAEIVHLRQPQVETKQKMKFLPDWVLTLRRAAARG